ncbi:monofunctional biosynthetic peptidoglycan transglycosylase [Vreelandella aquamarina]|jgi:monofunctional biosynthetic peptidoglycan transglycosylase|uniref:monofunctional biosynthetic peptidoglycan transglycosylase n=1 Tax=Halomonadaceae TaxID=28256 RepID=UPI0005CB7FFE|nr:MULTISPECIES: monofunctional biosynthetic peptidoglycan transglycosylase [Halomonas]KJD19015.1 peptidoglycan transglycosylase [Halomonas meridiana]MCC4289663.1 monofunctional biosynthetic peptidoglycan transglycosylase [Halomonas axialensis]MCD1651451.1 monofunctional biosynthetic peptidoglycan transglycosylase [Halomonas axialensis]MCD2087950.1 monofunctional biosynthetic peptidoglycan transglycosylase [Halomonas meridiana]MCF2912815.1 monofunctional biosynthetic peptidoglycan transglycosy|tara:strand:+ start:573 stop:1289 length:717 start_codon:yes stop_codon:yes gene_type:complete
MVNRALRRILRLLWRLVWRGTLAFVLLSVALVLLFRFVPPPGSMVMVERKVQSWINSEPVDIQRQWRSWENLSNNAKLAVIAAEDQRFPQHRGFDFVEMRRAWEASRDGERLRGASTLSQQTAKNVFLWSGRSWVRKGLEAWFTLLIETLWGKQRILEVYLNVAEWDTGVFGLEAAANHYFGASGSALTERQASLLAAILPNPRNRSASRPDAQVERRSQWIRQQMRNLGGTSFLERL